MVPFPANEVERLAALHDPRILDVHSEAQLDAVCSTAAALFCVPIAGVSLIAGDRPWFEARCGIAADATPRDVAFRTHATLSDDVLVVEDATADVRFADAASVTGEPHIRFYAGAPLILGSGVRLGTLYLIDSKPRSFSDEHRTRLQDLARIVVALVALDRGRPSIEAAPEERIRSQAPVVAGETRDRSLADALPQMVWVTSCADGGTIYTNRQFDSYHGPIGSRPEERTGRNHPADADRMGQAWQQAVAQEHSYSVDRRLRRHDGVYRWHTLTMVPVRRDGMVVEWLGTALDIEDIVTARSALEQATDLLRLAQEVAGAGVWQWNLDEDVVHHSPESARMHAIPCEPGSTAWVDVSLSEWGARVHPDDVAQMHVARSTALPAGTTHQVEFRVRQAGEGDAYRRLTGFSRIIRDEATGRPLRIVGLNLDVTEGRTTQDALVESEARLRASEERLALALDSGSDGLWDWDVATGQAWFSDRWQTMLGYEPGEVEQHVDSWERLTHPDDIERARVLHMEHFEGRTESYACEHRIRGKSGEYVWVLSRGRVASYDADGKPLRIVGTHIDITERKASEHRIAYMARHDVLTGLPNRAVFHEHLEHRLSEIGRGRGQAALLCLDLDRFKSVNDTLGHPAGDDLLCQIANRLLATVREGDVVVRLGGDEFAIITSHFEHAHQASMLAQRVIDAVGQPLDLGGNLVTVGVSIGIALAPTDGDAAATLFKNADLALYRAKASTGNTYCFYEAGMDAAVQTRMQLEFEMRQAIMCGSFALHYQPIMHLAGDRIVGFEALMRWPHPTRGMIAPGEFIPLAEETGLIVPLGDWALQEACREAASWPDDLRIAVNVSAIQFQQPGLEQSVLSALAAAGLAPHRLELEITESVLVQDAEAVIACLHRLKSFGVRIALDDFGTGYSSLSYLRRFPFDKLKIDRSFVKDIDNLSTAAIVNAIVNLGIALGMTITAEGIETEEQLAATRTQGCNEIQGYLYSKPLPVDRLVQFIGQRSAKAAA